METFPLRPQQSERFVLAEGEGFEPSRDFNSPNPLSRRAH